MIIGGGGNDILRGGDGDDRLISGPGRDILYGNGGADSLHTQDARRGNDVARGGAGAPGSDLSPAHTPIDGEGSRFSSQRFPVVTSFRPPHGRVPPPVGAGARVWTQESG